MKFVDLGLVCESGRTRSARLRELETAGLLGPTPKMVGRRAYTFYEITPLGDEVLMICEKLIQLVEKSGGTESR
jgi:DNA-binding HxlR family transcriptional regulator